MEVGMYGDKVRMNAEEVADEEEERE